MPSGQVPLWVPIAVAFLGFFGVVATQWITGRREDRRWRRETEREEQRWARERERERENRSYEGRAVAYREVIGAIEAFDWVLFQSRKIITAQDKEEDPTLPDEVVADLRQVTSEARNSLGGVNVQAPEPIRFMMRESMLRRSSLAVALIAGKYGEEEHQLWREGQREYKIMRAAMRRDLGLDTEDSGER